MFGCLPQKNLCALSVLLRGLGSESFKAGEEELEPRGMQRDFAELFYFFPDRLYGSITRLRRASLP